MHVQYTNNLYRDYYLLLGNRFSVVRSPQEVMRGYYRTFWPRATTAAAGCAPCHSIIIVYNFYNNNMLHCCVYKNFFIPSEYYSFRTVIIFASVNDALKIHVFGGKYRVKSQPILKTIIQPPTANHGWLYNRSR